MNYIIIIIIIRVYRSCLQSVMVYASETWAVRVEEEQRMERNENVMLRWM